MAKKKRAKQRFLPTMEPPVIKAVEAAADAYVEARDARMRHGQEEQERHEILMEQMRRHSLESYEYDGKVIQLVSSTKVKVRKKAEENGQEEE